MRLLSFKFQAHHIRGTQNVIADALSRMYEGETEPVVEPVLLEFPILFQDIGTYQRSDPELNAIIERLRTEEVPGYSLREFFIAGHDMIDTLKLLSRNFLCRLCIAIFTSLLLALI
jgi:hypothetical protein